jgi:hypothetical protein
MIQMILLASSRRLIPNKKGQTQEDRAKEIEGAALDWWMRNKGVKPSDNDGDV